MKLLHIAASPRTESSRTRSVADAFLSTFQDRYSDASVEEVDVFRSDLPDLTVRKQGDEFQTLGPDRLSGDPEEAWAPVEREIERVKQADLLLISTPMWNFQIPYRLKHFIDLIVQPGYTFQYTADGPDGLLDASAVVVTSRGGDYSDGSGAEHLDFQAPYLETILGFVGVDDVEMVHAQPMDSGDESVKQEALRDARERAKEAVPAIDRAKLAS
jgi:FMN-dependent NADH-azoreductase